jgi:predicted RNA binding protein YcfA (HicA-like mRNA interferase family)
MANAETDRRTTVPLHGKKTIKKGTLRAIIGQAGVGVQEFVDA